MCNTLSCCLLAVKSSLISASGISGRRTVTRRDVSESQCGDLRLCVLQGGGELAGEEQVQVLPAGLARGAACSLPWWDTPFRPLYPSDICQTSHTTRITLFPLLPQRHLRCVIFDSENSENGLSLSSNLPVNHSCIVSCGQSSQSEFEVLARNWIIHHLIIRFQSLVVRASLIIEAHLISEH